ncbi:hypothetical protein BSL78_21887, partial [Apostichopus japonicus]
SPAPKPATTTKPVTTRRTTKKRKPTTTLLTTRPTTTTTSHHTTERLPSQQFHFSTLVDVPIETTDPHTIFTAATQLGDLGVNNTLQGSGLRISQIAVIVGSMCLVIPILIIGIFVWRRNRTKSSVKHTKQSSSGDSNKHTKKGSSSLTQDNVPSYDDQINDEDTPLPLYSQVNKKRKKDDGNISSGSINTKEIPNQESRQQPNTTAGQGEVTIEADKVGYSKENPNEQTYSQTDKSLPPENVSIVKPEGNYKNVNDRINYENTPVMSQEESTYEIKGDFQPEVLPQENTYNQLDRLDRFIANQTVIGESVYEL